MTIESLYRKAQSTLSNEGIGALGLKTLKKILSMAYYSTTSSWFCRELSAPIPALAQRTNLDVDFLVDEKGPLLDWLRSMNSTYSWMYLDKEVKLASREKHIFVKITHNREIIGYIKVGVNSVYIHDFDKVVAFPPRTAFIYDTFILPEYRGKKISYYAVTATLRYLAEHKYNRFYCHIESWNKASLRLFEKSGFISIGTVTFKKIFGIPFFLRNGYLPSTSIEPMVRAC